jgi:glutathione S-transferase
MIGFGLRYLGSIGNGYNRVLMAIDFYWGSGSPPCWRVALALEHKGLQYNSHQLQFDRQEHKSPQMLAMNFRGRLPVLRDNDYVVFESLAILFFLDRKYPDPPIFGRTAEEAGVIMRVICEYQSYAEPPLREITSALQRQRLEHKVDDASAQAMLRVGGEARSIEQRLAHSDWVVGDSFSAADMMIYPDIRLLVRMLQKPQARELAARFLPMEVNYPAIDRWLERVAALPGHERTWPPHWR